MRWYDFVIGGLLIGLVECMTSKPAPVDTVSFVADLSKIDTKSTEILVQTTEIATQQKRIADSIGTMKASLVESQTQKVQEVINSSRIAPDNTANDSHPATLIVAESGAVRLLVSLADFACAPCDRLKQAVNDGEFNGFDVQYTDDWRPGSYPAIRYPTASSSTGWAVMYGYDDRTISRLRAATNPVVSQARNTTAVMSHAQQVAEHNRMHGGGNWTWPGDLATHLRDTHGVNLASNRGAPVGAIFQNYRSGTVTSQRSNIRPVSRWVGYGGRSRNKSSAACPAGGCP